MLKLVFYLLVKLRYYLYHFGILKKVKAKAKVISVGNISVGGTGKTPFVMLLAKSLAKDYKIAILTKGYKGRFKGVQEVNLDSTAEFFGDEPVMLKQTLKDTVIVVVAKNKTEGALYLSKNYTNLDYIIVDDGFQHLKLYRDIDIVLVNANRDLNDKLLPTGRLREPLSAIKRADIIVYTKTNFVNIDTLNLTKNTYISKAVLKSKQPLPKDAVLLTAIEDVSFLKKLLLDSGINLHKSISFPDHYKFTEKDIKDALSFKLPVLTTSKDIVKIPNKKGFIEVYYEHEVENCSELIYYIIH